MASRLVVALIVASLIMPIISSPAYAAEEEWKTYYAVNDFVNVGPADPYQIFKVHYRVLNGTIEHFTMPYVEYPYNIMADVTSNGNGTLEIMFPKNYPNTNADFAEAIFFEDYQEIVAFDRDTECFREFSIPFTGSKRIEVNWVDFLTNDPFRGIDVPESCIPETLVQDVVRTKDGVIAPYHQMKAGVTRGGLVFEIVEHPSGTAFYATPASAEILKERWSIR